MSDGARAAHAAQAFWEAEQEAERKRSAKRKEQVVKRWAKLVHGLRIRERLQAQYAERGRGDSSGAGAPAEVSAACIVCAAWG